MSFGAESLWPLDGAELVVGMGALAHRGALDVAAAAVVAEVEGAVWPDGQAVGPAAGGREQADLTIAGHTGAAVVADFRQHDRAVGAGHRAFGEAQAGCHDGHVAHGCRFSLLDCRRYAGGKILGRGE